MTDEAFNTDEVGSPEDRLRLARERLGKSPAEVAASASIDLHSYYDLEACENEVAMTISLRKLSKLCDVLCIRAKDLFRKSPQESQWISREELVTRIKAHLEATGIGVTEFEERVGFTISPALDNPSEVSSWNVDCLRFVCTEIGVKWIDALP